MASYADKGQNASQGAKKFSSGESKVLNFWSSIQTRGVSRVGNEEKYKMEMNELRLNTPSGVIQGFIFGKEIEGLDIYLEKKAEIDSRFEGKLVRDIVADNGDYIYSDEDIAEAKFVKENSL